MFFTTINQTFHLPELHRYYYFLLFNSNHTNDLIHNIIIKGKVTNSLSRFICTIIIVIFRPIMLRSFPLAIHHGNI